MHVRALSNNKMPSDIVHTEKFMCKLVCVCYSSYALE